MATFTANLQHISGIPLGGLGTGSVEIRPDGHFHEWQLFNLGQWAPAQPECCAGVQEPEMSSSACAFFIRTQAGSEEPLIRHLGTKPDFNNPYSASWMKNIEAVEFQGRCPAARLVYRDSSLPVQVSAALCSPFIPHEHELSGTPGLYVAFTLKNTSTRAQSVSLLGLLKNPLAAGADNRRLRNELARRAGLTCVTMRTDADCACRSTLGTICLGVLDGKASHITGEYTKYFHGYIARTDGMADAHEVVFHSWRETGALPNATGSVAPTDAYGPLTADAIAAMSDEQVCAALDGLRAYAFARGMCARVARVHPALPGTPEGRRMLLHNLGKQLDTLTGGAHTGQTWGDSALSSARRLAPGASCEIVFLLAWHFPNHYSKDGTRLGHQYEHRFADAAAVARFLAKNHANLRTRTLAFADGLYDTTEDEHVADAWSAQLSSLVKGTWWTKDGSFGVWEGLGCCGFHTTDVSYYATFNILALFPALQQRQMAMGARFQREDGRIHHMFAPDFAHVDNQFERVDMNQQFVLMACRDYLWTGDRKYLRRLWPHIAKAMDNTALLDADGDGLPDHETRRNTYDAWDFRGTPAYVASLWLSALRAAIRLGEEMHDAAHVAQWRDLLARGTKRFSDLLWNGTYFRLWVDGDDKDECCMTDQINGEWFTQLIGIGHCLPAAQVRKAMQAIWRHNYTRECGLRNAAYPRGTPVRPATFNNFQAAGVWTGIEFCFASMLLEYGFEREARELLSSLHDRHARCGRVWDHMECGDHYYRAMASWAVLLSLSGFKVDVPRGVLQVAPAVRTRPWRAPWFGCTGWGTLAQERGRLTLVCRAGTLAFRTLVTNLPAARVQVQLNRAVVPCSLQTATHIEFPAGVTLKEHDVLTVTVMRAGKKPRG